MFLSWPFWVFHARMKSSALIGVPLFHLAVGFSL
jgi:hypothetical protein